MPIKQSQTTTDKQTHDLAMSYLYDESKDKRKRKTTDTRKPPLSIRHLSRLNALKKAKTIEAQQRSKAVQRMYSQADKTTTVTQSTEQAPDGITMTTEREYEEVLEQWSAQHSFLNESTRNDLKQQYNDNARLVLTGVMYDNNTDTEEEPVFKNNSDLQGAVEALRQDVHNEIDEFADMPVYAALDHSLDTPFVDLQDAFGEITNVYSSDSQIYGEIELLADNDNARQLIDLALQNNNKIAVSITFYIDDDEVILTGCDAVSEPACLNAMMLLEVKQHNREVNTFKTDLERTLELAQVQRKEKD